MVSTVLRTTRSDVVYMHPWTREKCYWKSDWMYVVPRAQAAHFFSITTANCAWLQCIRHRHECDDGVVLNDDPSTDCIANERIQAEWTLLRAKVRSLETATYPGTGIPRLRTGFSGSGVCASCDVDLQTSWHQRSTECLELAGARQPPSPLAPRLQIVRSAHLHTTHAEGPPALHVSAQNANQAPVAHGDGAVFQVDFAIYSHTNGRMRWWELGSPNSTEPYREFSVGSST